jgi:hypothetical protein
MVYVNKQELRAPALFISRRMGDGTIGTMLGQLAGGMAMMPRRHHETLRLTALGVVTIPCDVASPSRSTSSRRAARRQG